ncbi:50S ribosomal protein L3 [candidate division WWE3 bacterium CG10_big_fil_rev_8_21_14_0_10_32_10]|uniref:Large ribosomal subunit protein uL3 n=1 Tax=candidate division WWE3 bacterium CG10_big_fil_rev_8_21_14_0_10_32_10 TaxID=1975090 RepID=A0A2H0RAZ2_UNCKA|nr:MAG: 50S ribosomal protein L3 [candidate division WWE3 bacterium CG10_big_fil_rev_8_21_14_0_10_32_10]
MSKIKAKKLNMSQHFLEDGVVVPFTWVDILENLSIKEGDLLNITGISKGKGFAGVIKKHGFSRGPKTHGASDRERSPGSIGSATEVSRVLKGKKMAGRHGNKTVTLKKRQVLLVDSSKVAVSGPLPGSYGSILKIELIAK